MRLPAPALPERQLLERHLPERRPPAARWPWPLRLRVRALPWPAPALLTWLMAWGLALCLRQQAPSLGLAGGFGLASALGLLAAAGLRQAGWVRRGMLAAGFPVSALASGWADGLLAAGASGRGLPAWAWLLALGLLLLAYPLRAWRDAPLFPTPRSALAGLHALTRLAPGARVLDAGCGLGHGLLALREALPQARIEGVEWSWPLRIASAWRCPWAQVRQGDMWRASWQGLGLVYLFQRPESMARAWAKAQAELAPGAWLASLEFEVPGRLADASLQAGAGKPVWLYRVGPPGRPAAQPDLAMADKPSKKPARPGRQRHPD